MTSDFGQELRRRRAEIALSQSRLAHAAGLDHSYVSRLEAGARRPTRATAERLAAALGVSGPERARMLAAAGFLPNDPLVMLAEEPEITALLMVLGSERVPDRFRDDVRRVVWSLANLAEATYPVS